MTDRELMQQALDALEHAQATEPIWKTPIREAREALRARLAQPENEFNPDWNAMAVMVDEQQRMAAEIETLKRCLFQAQEAAKALAQPEPEPVAVWELQEGGWDTIADPEWLESLPIGTKLYTAPPQREWQGLTEHEKDLLVRRVLKEINYIEALLREKNSG